MKTLKIFLLCFIAVFTINTVNAQNRVVKVPELFLVEGPDQLLPCTGEYVYGWVTFEDMFMHNKTMFKLKDASIIGCSDPWGKHPTGNVYEAFQVLNIDDNTSVNHIIFRLNGKIVAEEQFVFHQIVDKDGNITVVVEKGIVNCK